MYKYPDVPFNPESVSNQLEQLAIEITIGESKTESVYLKTIGFPDMNDTILKCSRSPTHESVKAFPGQRA